MRGEAEVRADTETVAGGAAVAEARPRRAAFHRLTVAGVSPLTDDARLVTFAVPPRLRQEYRFRAGQHLTLRAEVDGEQLRRSYSICVAEGSGLLRVAVKRQPDGAFSGYVHQRLATGDAIDVMTPAGNFTVDVDPGRARHYGMVAAGSGITPIISIMATVLAREPRSRCTLWFGNRSTASVMFLEELADLKDRYPDRLQLLHVLSRERSESPLLSGRLDRDRLPRLLEAFVEPAGLDQWLLCGPVELVRDAREVLAGAGVAEDRVRFELFHAGAPRPGRVAATPPAGADGTAGVPVTVILDGRSTTVLVRAGEPLLEAVLRARPEAPYSCRSGVCGTCRAVLRSGRVRMEQNFALEPQQLRAGMVLSCQSRLEPADGQGPAEAVVLDFDG